jgi:aryl-alcohol dehydrogenase-like predicted oxidoreductase
MKLGKAKNAAPSEVALAWLLAQKPFIVPIPGTRSMEHLNENLEANHLILSPQELESLETAFSALEVHGGRMNEMQMKIVE